MNNLPSMSQALTTNLTFKIKKANLLDLKFIHQSIQSLSEQNIGLQDFETLFKSKTKSQSFTIFILEDRSRLGCNAGLLVVQLQQNLSDKWPTIEIQELFILPKYRKFKAADFLYTYLEQFAKDQKAYKIKVNCKINSTLNQNFYTAKGFKISKKQYVKEVY